MASLAMKIEAERRMRELLAAENLPEPDRVEYGHGCVRLYFEATKVVVVVDIDDYSEIDASMQGRPRDADVEPPSQREAQAVPIPPIPFPTRQTNGGRRDRGTDDYTTFEPGGEAA